MLGMAKRGDRSGLKDKNGNKTGSIVIQRGVGTISWDYAPPEQFVVDKSAAKKPWGGRPRR